jgi:hypothetical protein
MTSGQKIAWLGFSVLSVALITPISMAMTTDSLQPGLDQRNILPAYRFWLSDPAFSELSQEVVTPHTPWATPYSGKELNLVVIAPRWTQRATIELQQRFDFDATPIMAYRSHAWGDENDPHYFWIPTGTEEILSERAMATIGARRRPDVVVIGWMDTSVIPDNVQQAILDAVTDGSGLVIFNPKGLSDKLKALLEQCDTVAAETVTGVVDGIPTGKLPPLSGQNPRDLIGQGIKFYQQDDGGRVAVVDYSPLAIGPYPENGSRSYFSPPGADNPDVRDIHYDYYCSLAGKVMLWAGRNMPRDSLSGWENLSGQVDTKAGSGEWGSLIVTSDRLSDDMTADWVIRDEDGDIEHRCVLDVSVGGEVQLDLPPLKSGGHYADIILRDAHGNSLDWGSKFFVSDSGARIISVTTERTSYKPHETIPIRIAMEGDFSSAELLVEISDSHGRLILTQTLAPTSEISLETDLSDALSIRCEVRAILQTEATVLAQHTGSILLQMPKPETDQYYYGAWAGNGYEFVEKQSARAMVNLGVSGGVISGVLDEWAKLNVRPTPYVTRYYPGNTGKGLMARKPCLTDPEFLKEEEAKIRKATTDVMQYAPVAYSLGDDQGMMLTGQDACISDTCLPAFRAYLAQQYGSVKQLNESWGTQFSSLDEAEPSSLEDVLADGHYPRWADHRMYMDDLFVDTHIRAKSIIQDVDPEARVGFEGPLMDDSWYGYEWKKLMDNLDFMAVYPNGWKFDIVRSFARPGLLMGGWYGGYAMYQNMHDLQSYPWFMLFNQCNSYWFFSGYGWSEAGHPSEAIAPDLRPLKCFAVTSEHVNRIQQGIDRLVLNAKPIDDRVAVYYSRPSVHGATVMPAIPTRDYNSDANWSQYMAAPNMKWTLNLEANLRLLDDVGITYVLVDRHDIAEGKLRTGNFALLVMPLVHSMAKAEVVAVKDFVESGGTVVADVRPGVFDEHGKLFEEGPLDDLFGIRRTGSAVMPLRDELIQMAVNDAGTISTTGGEGGAMLPEQVDYAATEDEKQPRGFDRIPVPIDTTVAVNGGKAAAKSESDSPIFIRNDYGKGKTCLMNMAIQHYLTLRAAGRGAGLQGLYRDILAAADIAPNVRVQAAGDHAARVRVFRYQHEDSLLIGLLRPHKRLLDESDGFLDSTPRPFAVHFGRSGHVYDVIQRTYHGQVDSLELDIPVATAMLFAVLPYQVTGLTAEVTQQDQRVTLSPTVQIAEGQPGWHVVNVRITDAEGMRRPEYDMDVIAPDAHGSHTFTLALNDPPGQWMIDLEDVATGTSAQTNILIIAPASSAL